MFVIFLAILILLDEVCGEGVYIRASPDGPVPLGATVTITCVFPNATTAPTKSTWSFDGNHIRAIPLDPRFDISHRNTVPPRTSITIRQANEEDSGAWKCKAFFPGSRRGGPDFTLEGRYALHIGAPRIEYITSDRRVSIGDNVTLYCHASGDPPPAVSWSRDYPFTALPLSSDNEPMDGKELTFTVRGLSYQGNYQCTAVNTLGSQNRTVRVNVNHAPFFVGQQPSVMKGRIGIPIALSLVVSSYPPPSVSWYKGGASVNSTRLLSSASTDGILSLKFLPQEFDFGRYSCVAENEYGRVQQSLLLIPDGPPARPVSVIPKRVTMTSVLLKVENGLLAGGVPITKYRITYREVGTTYVWHHRFNVPDAIALKGLLAGITYVIYVSAGNQAGWSEYAEPMFVTTRQYPVPTTPSAVTEMRNLTTPVLVVGVTIGNVSTPNASASVTRASSSVAVLTSYVVLPNHTSAQMTTSKTTPPDPRKYTTTQEKAFTEFPQIVGAVFPNTGNSRTNDSLDVPVNGPSPQRSAIVTICLVLAAVVCMMLIGACLFMLSSISRNRLTKRSMRRSNDDYMDESFYEEAGTPNNEEPIQYRAKPQPSLISSFLNSSLANFEFPSEGIIIGNIIGQGSFGVVFEAEAFGILQPNVGTKVAVKTLKEDYNGDHEIAFQKELDVLARLKPHPFIVNLLGCCTTTDVQLIIMERLKEGNLLTHLRQSKQHITNHATQRVSMRTTLLPCALIKYGYEIANGMAYLATMKCIHRDLAARNVLLSREGVCKLTDFNLARDVLKDGLTQRRTQGRSSLRWMALESLLENVFTIRSNVWSFGVVLWEILTIGSYPYAGITSSKLTRHLIEGNRMAKPDYCNQEVYSLMIQCWQSDPKKRPKFDELSKKLEATLTDSRNYLVLDDLNDSIYECAA